MSLLMDALKKAELAKRQGATDQEPGPEEVQFGGLTLEPLLEPSDEGPPAESPEVRDPRPEPSMSLSSHLEELDARFLEEVANAARQVPATPVTAVRKETPAPPPPPNVEPVGIDAPTRQAIVPERRPATPDSTADDQIKAAAQNLFAAKQPEKPDSRRGFAIAIGLLTVVSVAAIGGYFWWQLQPKKPMIALAPPAPPIPMAPKPAAAPATPNISAPNPNLAAVQPSPTPASPTGLRTEAGVQAGAKPTLPINDEDEDAVPATQTRATARPQPVRPPRARTTDLPPPDDSPIRITREPLRVDPAISRGYDALGRGEFNLAKVEYERARKNDPRNRDVLHGLAAIALRQGQPEQADAYYRQIVELDPQDSVAVAALLNQRGHVDPSATENRLKSLATAQPELAAPHFSLGNLFARQGRWNDAQQAYFRAYNAEPENPDILFNLAVSLEHLRQNKLAAQYYAQAVASAETRPAAFDRAKVAARIPMLQR